MNRNAFLTEVLMWTSGFVIVLALLHLLSFLLNGLIHIAGLWIGWALFIVLTGGFGVVVFFWSLGTKEKVHATP